MNVYFYIYEEIKASTWSSINGVNAFIYIVVDGMTTCDISNEPFINEYLCLASLKYFIGIDWNVAAQENSLCANCSYTHNLFVVHKM